MPQPLVTICVPAYNAEATIGETLATILGQSYTNLEVIVSDNRSTDRTRDIVAGLQDPRLSIVSNETNIGGEANFERCMALGRGEFKAIYHADDLYERDIVEKQVAFLLAHPGAGAVTTRLRFIDDQGRLGRQRRWPHPVRSVQCLDYASTLRLILRHGNFIVTPSVMARATVLRKVRTWNGKDFGTSADLDVWLRIAKDSSFGFLDEPLVRYRWSQHSYSYRQARRNTQEADFLRVMRAHLADSPLSGRAEARALRDYAMQRRADFARRARNAHLGGDKAASRSFLAQALGPQALRGAFTSRLGLRALVLAVLTLIDMRLPGSTRWVLAAQ